MANTASATSPVVYVNGSSGNDANNGTSWLFAKKTIGNAIGTVEDNGTVNIADGNYTGSGNTNIIISRNMNIIGQSLTGTIIDGTGNSQIFNINSVVYVTIQNLTLAHGYTSNGAAIYNLGNLTVNNCNFSGNTATNFGGAIDNSKTLTLNKCSFTDNHAGLGGAICNLYGTVNAHFNRFFGNSAPYGNDIYSSNVDTVNVNNNWWGSNADPATTGSLYLKPSTNPTTWLVLNIWAPSKMHASDTALIVADLRYDNLGNYHDPNNEGFVPDGIPITFSGTSGSFNPINITTINGSASTSYTAGSIPGTVTVYAAVDNANRNTPISVMDGSNIYVSTTGNDDTGSGSSGNPFKTISTGIAWLLPGGTLHITNGEYSGTGNTGITIDKNMIITGQSQNGTIINANNTSQIFYINSGTNVTIQNLTLENGNSNCGGAILNYSALNVTGCTFTGNYAQASINSRGGAIYNWYGTCSINGSTFTGNYAGSGGAIYNDMSTLIVTSSTFTNNSAITDLNMCFGGAIHNGYGSNCTVTGSTFANNTATSYSNTAHGGAINNAGTCTVTSSTFANNTASSYFNISYGGAIYNDMSGDCTFNFNRIYGNNATYGKVISGFVDDFNNWFGAVDAANNWWGSNSGPASGSLYGMTTPTTWLVLNITAPNKMTASGIAIITADLTHDNLGYNHTEVFIPNGTPVTFSGTSGSFNPVNTNTSHGDAGTFYTAASTPGTATVHASVDNENTSASINVIDGTNIYVSATGNDITGDGSSGNPFQTISTGISLIAPNGNLHIADGVYNEVWSTIIDKNITIIGQSQAGTIIDGNSNIDIFNIKSGTNVKIQNLTLANGGEAINNLGACTVIDCTFTGNAVHAIMNVNAVENFEQILTINFCTFIGNGNTANGSGGAIFNYNSPLYVSCSNFIDNNAFYGGAICNWYGDRYINPDLTVYSSSFTNNNANDGGAIYNYGSSLNVRYSNFIGNTANDTTVSGGGGAIYNNCSTFTSYVISNRIIGNTAIHGKDIFNIGDTNVNLNWWGSNTGPATGSLYGITNPSFWLTLNISAPNKMLTSSTATITADLTHDNFGNSYNYYFVPDGIQITFSGTSGTFNPVNATTFNGSASTTFTSSSTPGNVTVYTAVDNQTLNKLIYIDNVVNTRTGITYNTIQTAIDDPNTINGDTLIVAEGTLTENVIVNKTLSIIANGITTIQAQNSNLPVLTITSTGNGSNVQGFIISGSSASSGILLSNANNCNIQNNTITGNLIGILLKGNQNNITDNNINGNLWAGICADTVSGNQIINNIISQNPEGIYLQNTGQSTITGNQIINNIVNGINIQSSALNTITNNTISGNGVSTLGNGIIIKKSSQNDLYNNTIQNNGWSGIVLDGSSNNIIGNDGNRGNTISGNDNGLVLYGTSDLNNIEYNTISNNHYNGLELYSGCEQNNITQNSFNNNGVIGILVQYSNNNTIDTNTIQNGNYNGIVFDNSSNNHIQNNHINNVGNTTDMGGIGILMVQNSNNNTINNNYLTGNIWTNAVLDHCSQNQMTGNTINGNHTSQQGILLINNCNLNTINGNSVSNNTAVGISLQNNCNTNNINQNTITSNGIIGILLDNSNNNTLNHNTLQNNGWAGTCLSNSNENNITQNNYLNNPEQTYDNSTNNYDNGTTGNYYSNWFNTNPRSIDGGSNIDHHPSLTPF